MTDRRQFVCDYDRGPIYSGFVQCLLDFSLGVWVKCACGFIEE